MNEPSNPELESFRQQWRAEVFAKSKPGDSSPSKKSTQPPSKPTARRPSVVPQAPPRPSADAESDNEPSDEDADLVSPAPLHPSSFEVSSARSAVEKDVEKFSGTATKEPESALEHYEKAAERELQGNLGDSLTHYRKAFRIDDRVDLKYKNKHFPPSAGPKPTTTSTPSSATPATPATPATQPTSIALSTPDLLTSFSSLLITPAPPPIEGAPAPPCPIATLPEEILTHILTDLALLDPASFLRTAQTCKRLAYLIATEDQIYKRICQGHEVGFGGMHYSWQLEVSVAPLPVALGTLDGPPADEASAAPRAPLLLNTLYPSYATMFRHRPRIRFDGLYISTVNYMRAGAAAATQSTWDSPVHIVTYYRYLRFFRSGAVISLLGTHEPSEVVHALLTGLLEGKRAPKGSPVADARRGRWRLGGGGEGGRRKGGTEGCDERYIYRMALRVKGQERGRARLGWEGFWNWNRLTDDWAEFGLRNDKPFVFSKVHSYGVGV
ncbi:hypothetical protein VC83_07552 [Pseudogymnoascus destructans]|uniref:F-box domain-containing protein n=1 Tax=Pseudogymnoascus destructans TaxID=655981 RepID=A0A177A202_9PEZI|nr:uncharacterized protein VC83_07552 [Pseudogymnoascus destructans]OAF56127.1 hypothetical protein VC83_07552 [Pseudogymnoascus destructans]